MVLWSNASITSEWVREEAEEGRKRQILVPVLIDDVIPPMGFRMIQAADLINWDGEFKSVVFQKLISDINAILENNQICEDLLLDDLIHETKQLPEEKKIKLDKVPESTSIQKNMLDNLVDNLEKYDRNIHFKQMLFRVGALICLFVFILFLGSGEIFVILFSLFMIIVFLVLGFNTSKTVNECCTKEREIIKSKLKAMELLSSR